MCRGWRDAADASAAWYGIAAAVAPPWSDIGDSGEESKAIFYFHVGGERRSVRILICTESVFLLICVDRSSFLVGGDKRCLPDWKGMHWAATWVVTQDALKSTARIDQLSRAVHQ